MKLVKWIWLLYLMELQLSKRIYLEVSYQQRLSLFLGHIYQLLLGESNLDDKNVIFQK